MRVTAVGLGNEELGCLEAALEARAALATKTRCFLGCKDDDEDDEERLLREVEERSRGRGDVMMMMKEFRNNWLFSRPDDKAERSERSPSKNVITIRECLPEWSRSAGDCRAN